MARWLTFLACIGLTLAVTIPGTPGEGKVAKVAGSRNFEVRMIPKGTGFVYDQEDIEIQDGDTVTWINASGAKHTATPDKDSPLAFEGVEVDKGKFSKRVHFDKKGKAKYHCEIHPDMHGTINVK